MSNAYHSSRNGFLYHCNGNSFAEQQNLGAFCCPGTIIYSLYSCITFIVSFAIYYWSLAWVRTWLHRVFVYHCNSTATIAVMGAPCQAGGLVIYMVHGYVDAFSFQVSWIAFFKTLLGIHQGGSFLFKSSLISLYNVIKMCDVFRNRIKSSSYGRLTGGIARD